MRRARSFPALAAVAFLSACGGGGGGGGGAVVETAAVAPVAEAVGEIAVSDGDVVTLDGSGSRDPDGGRLTYSWRQTGGTPVVLTGATTARATFTAPQLASDAVLTFALTVRDDDGLTAVRVVTVTITADDDPPIADAGGDVAVSDGDAVTLDGSGSRDPEGGALTYSWRQTGGTPTVSPTGANAASLAFSTPQLSARAALTFELTVTDPGGASASDTATVTVRADNDPPTANAGSDVTVDEGDPTTLDGSGSSDPEGATLTYAWAQTGGSTVGLSGAATARATFTAPDLEANADLTFRLTTTDPGGASANDTATVTVRADNDAPAANAGSDVTVDDGTAVTLDGSGSSDPEGATLTYAWAQTGGSPTVTLTGASTSAPTFSTPQLAAQASLTFGLTVTDPGGRSANDAVTVTVRADDDAPTANAGTDFTTYEGDAATLDGSGSSDPEGGTLTYSWAQSAGTGTPTATLTGASTSAPTFTAPAVTANTALTFTLTVSDAGGQSATDTVTVTVRNVRPAGSTVRAPASGETLEPATAKSTASSWETAEYAASVGLPLINAATGYAARTMGEPGGGGVTVAVIDGTIVTDHPDLAGATRVETGVARIIGTHGTRVAGVVAARRNGTGMHGVAYNANVVNMAPGSSGVGIEPAFASVAGLTGTYSYPGNRYTYTANPAGSAHIAVMSLGYPPERLSGAIANRATAALRLAAGRGRIVVASTGNSVGSEPRGYPARAFAEEGIAGLAIAVTALNEAGTGWDSGTNQCGSVKQYCLMAPGNDIYTTTGRPDSTGRGYATVSGTSYSAPYVGGAAAVLWAAFPNKTGRQIVERLLTTARQIDATTCAYDATTGVSAKCGHGALDLGAAMNPVGFTTLALPGGGVAPVRETVVRLPPGASAAWNPGLADVVVYDRQGFPFLHDLNGAFRAVAAAPSDGALAGFAATTGGRRWTTAPLRSWASLSFAGPDRRAGRTLSSRWSLSPSPPVGEAVRDYRLRLALGPGLALTAGRGRGVPGPALAPVALRGDWDPLGDGLSFRPFAAFAGRDAGVGLDWRPDGRTALALTHRAGEGRFGATRASLTRLGVAHRFAGGLRIDAGFGRLREAGARLGLASRGAFGAVAGGETDVAEIGFEKPVSDRAGLFGGYSVGETAPRSGAANSLASSWGRLRSDALALGLDLSGLVLPLDRLTVTASAPLRVRGRIAEVLVPVRETADGVVAYAARAVDLASADREVRTQVVYRPWNADRLSASIAGSLRLAPAGSPASHDPDWSLAAKITLGF